MCSLDYTYPGVAYLHSTNASGNPSFWSVVNGRKQNNNNTTGNPSLWSAVNRSKQNNNNTTGNPSFWSAVNRSKQNNNKSTGNPSFWSAVIGSEQNNNKSTGNPSFWSAVTGDLYPDVPSGSSKVSDFFEDNIKALPSENCEEDVIQELYIQVIEQFGTHYTTEVVMGAKAVQESKFKNSDLDKFQSDGISAEVAAKMSVKQGGVSASGGFKTGVANNKEMRDKVSNTSKEQREYYIGGSPPSGDYSTGSTETLREWARSAAENPVPIQYKLSSIDSLIRPKYFKKTGTGCPRKEKFTKVVAVNVDDIDQTEAPLPQAETYDDSETAAKHSFPSNCILLNKTTICCTTNVPLSYDRQSMLCEHRTKFGICETIVRLYHECLATVVRLSYDSHTEFIY
ncbi:unnamed protein product [Mytilus coruscus]|uniref:MACPF domain-containing protein n=1 Tax=Mytilus coruscus TaxID=42192 RepID=A0A6J8DHU3_MYTCO|nr:unnamed protein product [Mytilus coruscus]